MVTDKAKEENQTEVATQTWKNRIPTFIAITTLLLAVCATLASFKAAGYGNKMVLAQSQASDQWAFYQAKSIKETAYQTQRDAMELASRSGSVDAAAYREKIAVYDKEVTRYQKEKNEIMAAAKKLEAARDLDQKHNANFGQSLIWLQIGILFSSLASISKNHLYWYAGTISGIAGVVAFGYALMMAP
jgi:hypothetical protein